MHYLEILVSDGKFHGSGELTYSHPYAVPPGSLVMVPLRDRLVPGVVIRQSNQAPPFTVKPLSSILDIPPLPQKHLQLLDWMRQYYPGPLGILTQIFVPPKLGRPPAARPSPHIEPARDLPALSTDQQAALAALAGPGLHLLHGDTGSGKTRVYIELARRQLTKGRSCIILVPEIGLTPQLTAEFSNVFGERVIVLHSQLGDATRTRIWSSILQQDDPLIIIGPRSALFSPLKDIGLVVVDEAHETAYKQDQAPHYHASTVAAKLALLHKATFVLGSATPLVHDYYIASIKKRPIIRMQQAAKKSSYPAPTISIVDLRNRNKFTRSPYLSSTLLDAIHQAIEQKEQSLIFLNRRGTARVVFCDKCGWQANCRHCDLPLTYHGDRHIMRCHSCTFVAAPPSTCPDCRNASIIFKNIGTKAIVGELERLFPSAKIMRFDTDNKRSERLEQNFEAVKQGKIDILVGTQTLAKGLDLPFLSVVGIVVAETNLSFPDFSSEERTYQLLSQVIGRIGRGHRQGQAIIQTYAPQSPLLKAVVRKEWHTFYNRELGERKAFCFPPFCFMLKLTCQRASSRAAETAAEKLALQIRDNHPSLQVEGPAPAFREKVQNKFLWQIIIKTKQRAELLQVINALPNGWSYDIDPVNLL